MSPDARALVAAAVHAFKSGRKVAGLYDHDGARHRRIAAEARGDHLQGYDGDRDVRFGGTLPEILDAGERGFISMALTDDGARGFDRGSNGFYTARIADRIVQLFDHAADRWFVFDIRSA